MNLKEMLGNERVRPYLLKARYGIEKEGQRVDLSGNLAKTDHPEVLSARDQHPYIQRDFSETQMELITPVTDSIEELFNHLSAIHDVAYRSMSEQEMIWPLSMPPQLPEKEEDIVIAKLKNFESVLYRRYLAKSYGRRKQMISGIHFNFEFDDQLIRVLFNLQSEIKEYRHFKSEIYLKLTRNYIQYRWLTTYFYGASPVSEKNFFEEDSFSKPVRSIRSSKYGYTNSDEVQVSYSSIENYAADLESMVKKGYLIEEKEFYSAIRLRSKGHVSQLEEQGVRYVELRNIDLNPFEMYGISREQVEFLHLFLVYLLWKDESADCKSGESYNNTVALEHPLESTQFKTEAEQMIDEMEQVTEILGLTVSDTLFVNLREMLADPSKTLSGRLYKEIEKNSQKQTAVSIAKENYAEAWAKPYQLTGFTDMELSTQILMFDAIQQGLQVEILDRQDQFLKLKLHDHIEYVKNGNMTSKDSYVSPLIMENKTVTKKILHQQGFRVPLGDEFNDIEDALRAYEVFSAKPFVVKPKTTNYGLGISIFKDGAGYDDYQQAITLAFQEDSSVLIEEFLSGTEYRFFVLNEKVHAVLLRTPANVTGDGKQTIEELVNEKNRDPLRGRDHRTPLEIIELGDLEVLMLKGQGYQPDSIPKADEVVYLRENSNVSTGGDSIDVTDQIPEDYKKIAADAVAALEAKISGIDLIIENTEVPAADENAYGIIEANFNPSMYMHIYPYKGTSRRLTREVIAYLFPELFEDGTA
ncbi:MULTISPECIES: bifunctional glutamate--cysteine ligase GshA/glutathione synthetase GshB [unclassified Sporosarcina]|uniref:bifunctional glutamate--cysteine ligase GshA/glutathione synthetase GshB n=1 Tax=unclassified Sporosarcina TaxID=2647733 RepID=UPI00203D0B71|nr:MULTISPECIES: bifunctional glutamate--cysteine ligase GshA/glutathione synthetase GshB [unclassified Sporosarcina]GKV64086.1 glutathione biosynthesis bifunctional protein GshAB [Sporosarcina sp. NCCP-2331]GLB56339.1 glutathione biosynthesis bifunctional protein GshAB [Sporosarcina sp. NCCP-2378]